MGFRQKILFHLVHLKKLDNKTAKELIKSGKVKVNDTIVFENQILNKTDNLYLNNELIRKGMKHTYIRYHKPVGIECTMDKENPDSVYHIFKHLNLPLQICGRLDKASEGLLLLTTDGSWNKKITRPEFEKEKEYLVTVSKEIDRKFCNLMSSGIDIGGYVTKPCECNLVDATSFKIILKEGRNKQIRRMCKKLDNLVTRLIRLRINNIELKDLEPGCFEMLKNI
ncbi:MAG: pseudouridine synthase [Bacteroidia bacterium]